MGLSGIICPHCSPGNQIHRFCTTRAGLSSLALVFRQSERKIMLMNHVIIKVLVLGSGLLLSLPSGWCCMVWGQPVVHATEVQPSPPPSRCPHCCEEPSPTQPSPSTPAHSSAPGKAPRCPCAERLPSQTAVAEKVEHSHTLPLLSLVPPLALAEVAGPAFVERSTFETISPSRPIHILQCVWRC